MDWADNLHSQEEALTCQQVKAALQVKHTELTLKWQLNPLYRQQKHNNELKKDKQKIQTLKSVSGNKRWFACKVSLKSHVKREIPTEIEKMLNHQNSLWIFEIF